MNSKKLIFLITCFSVLLKARSKSSLQLQVNRNSDEVKILLKDYFDWKVNTYKLNFYIEGFNDHPGELDDLSPESFERIETTCTHFYDRANEILTRKEQKLPVRDRRYVKVLSLETKICAEASKVQVQIFS